MSLSQAPSRSKLSQWRFLNTTRSNDDTHFALREAFTSKFGLPQWFWTSISQKANGFYFGEKIMSTQGDSGYLTLFRLLVKAPRNTPPSSAGPHSTKPYGWIKLTFLVRWHALKNIIVLCFDNPTDLRERVRQSLVNIPGDRLLKNPFLVHSQLLQHVLPIYDEALWMWRDLVREHENNRPTVDHLHTDYTRPKRWRLRLQ